MVILCVGDLLIHGFWDITCYRCGYDLEGKVTINNMTDGMLGLNKSPASLFGQLSCLGRIKRILGHCVDEREFNKQLLGEEPPNPIGYLFLGDKLIPNSGMTWAKMVMRR